MLQRLRAPRAQRFEDSASGQGRRHSAVPAGACGGSGVARARERFRRAGVDTTPPVLRQARRALQAVQSDLERDVHREWDWRQGCAAATSHSAARSDMRVAVRVLTPPLDRTASSRSKQQAEAAEPAAQDAPASADAPAEDEPPAEGAAVDPGVASAAAASRAAAAFAAGDAAAACAAWTEALIWAPGDAVLLCRRAEGQLVLGRAPESLADARNAALLRPRLAEPQLRAGIALMALHKPNEAAAAFRRALELEPSHEARCFEGRAVRTPATDMRRAGGSHPAESRGARLSGKRVPGGARRAHCKCVCSRRSTVRSGGRWRPAALCARNGCVGRTAAPVERCGGNERRTSGDTRRQRRLDGVGS